MAKHKGCRKIVVKHNDRWYVAKPASCKKHRRSAQTAKIAKAGRHCAKRGKPGSKSNVACLRAYFR